MDSLEQAARLPGVIALRSGDVPRAFAMSARTHAATYRVAPAPTDPWAPASLGRLWACLDAAGLPVAWRHRVACATGAPRRGAEDLETAHALEGALDLPYRVANVLVEHARAESRGGEPMSRQHAGLRANVFAVESFVDELAASCESCPLEYRRRLVGDGGTLRAVLDVAAACAQWDVAPARGRARGVALQRSRGCSVVVVVEVGCARDAVHILRVTAAADCGVPGAHGAFAREIQACIAATLRGALHEPAAGAPRIEFHFVDGRGAPEAIAACVRALVAPAIGNAVFAACGRRIRRLPLVSTHQEVS